MRWLFLAPLLLATEAAAEPQPSPSVSVQGICTVSATPDRARVFVGAEVTGPDAAKAASGAISQYNRFRADVEKLALPDAALTSTGVQTDRSTDERNGKLITTGYTARAGLTVETSSLPGIARVMQDAATDGMASVGGMELYLSDGLRRTLEQSCLPKATADAKERAAALLAGLGVSLGDVLSVGSGDMEQPMPKPMFAAAPMAMARSAPMPELSAGPQTITVTANVTFAIAPQHK
jgi:uncharacterized protein